MIASFFFFPPPFLFNAHLSSTKRNSFSIMEKWRDQEYFHVGLSPVYFPSLAEDTPVLPPTQDVKELLVHKTRRNKTAVDHVTGRISLTQSSVSMATASHSLQTVASIALHSPAELPRREFLLISWSPWFQFSPCYQVFSKHVCACVCIHSCV